jgi:valyl-tRNA synthetase
MEALKLLHPVMPFITEEIAGHLGAAGPLISAEYPAGGRYPADPDALSVMSAFQAVVQETRSYRHMVGLPPSAQLAVCLTGLNPALLDALRRLTPEMERLAGLSSLGLNPAAVPAGAVRDLAGGVNIAIVLPAGVLGEAEAGRLVAELAQTEAELVKVTARLADAKFTGGAPAEVVAGARQRAEDLTHKSRLLAATLGREP